MGAVAPGCGEFQTGRSFHRFGHPGGEQRRHHRTPAPGGRRVRRRRQRRVGVGQGRRNGRGGAKTGHHQRLRPGRCGHRGAEQPGCCEAGLDRRPGHAGGVGGVEFCLDDGVEHRSCIRRLRLGLQRRDGIWIGHGRGIRGRLRRGVGFRFGCRYTAGRTGRGHAAGTGPASAGNGAGPHRHPCAADDRGVDLVVGAHHLVQLPDHRHRPGLRWRPGATDGWRGHDRRPTRRRRSDPDITDRGPTGGDQGAEGRRRSPSSCGRLRATPRRWPASRSAPRPWHRPRAPVRRRVPTRRPRTARPPTPRAHPDRR